MISEVKPRNFDVVNPVVSLNSVRVAELNQMPQLSSFQQVMGGKLSHLKVGIVTARFNPYITEPLRLGAIHAFTHCGLAPEQILQTFVPGAVELPLAARWMMDLQGVDAVVCLGCVIRGDTDHYDYVCTMAANGIQQVSLETGKPVMFGLLTCDTQEQAVARIFEPNDALDETSLALLNGRPPIGNKGMDAAHAALEMLALLEGLPQQQPLMANA
jgi:6,7-dimethyl-8-ribityllumazine synthase